MRVRRVQAAGRYHSPMKSHAPVARRLDALLRQARERIDPVDAEFLLGHVLGKPRGWLFAHRDDSASDEVAAAFEALVHRRACGEPVAYLTGQRGFWSFDLTVTPATLIPRPETELLVELALARLPTDRPLRVADLGTGSGAIALALAHERPRAQVVASNPPYIALDDPHLAEGDLRFEPASALSSGADGLDAIRRIVAAAPAHLQAGGWLLLEHGWEQGAAVRALLRDAGFVEVATERDLEDRDRVTLGRKPV
jgi:release factor glutamine methyltransferase